MKKKYIIIVFIVILAIFNNQVHSTFAEVRYPKVNQFKRENIKEMTILLNEILEEDKKDGPDIKSGLDNTDLSKLNGFAFVDYASAIYSISLQNSFSSNKDNTNLKKKSSTLSKIIIEYNLYHY